MDLILVASNDLRTREDFKTALSVQGWWVAAVENRQGALQAAADQAPRLVIVDGDLEGAVDLVVAFGSRNGGPGVLACGVEPDSAETLRLHEAGVDGVVDKPVRAAEVLAAVDRVLSGPRLQVAPPPPSPTRRLTTVEIFGEVLRDLGDEEDPEAARVEPSPPVAAEPAHAEPVQPVAAAPAVPESLPPLAAEPALGEPLPPLAAAPAHAEPVQPVLAAPTRAEAAPPLAAEPAVPESLPAVTAEPAVPESLPPLAAAPARTEPEPPTAVGLAPPAPLPPPAAEPPEPVPVPDSVSGDLPPAALAGDADKQEQADGLFEETTSPAAAAGFDFGEPLSPPPLPLELDGLALPVPAEAAGVDFAAGPAAAGEEPTGEGLRGFGQYQLEERIAVGGMAEVWKARLVGVAGFRKTVALKRILPELTEHRSFVDMFVDEAKLAAGLKHRNIVDIYDLGRIGDDYFIAMEFVEGRDLRRILEKARGLGQRIPLPLAVLVGARLAAALHYAHRQRDPSGRPLGIVHRDVSPRNILVGAEGSVKLCDFGVAKAVTIVSRTQFGALKGKIPYMSPEQARGEPVDSRSDIFSLGTVLFELVTGQRPFVGESEISLLEAVRKCETPPLRDLEPEAPEKLGEIVARALRGAPEERYGNAGDLQRDLEELLRTFRPAPDEEHLAAFVECLFLPASGIAGSREWAPAAAEAPSAQPGAAAPPETDETSRALSAELPEYLRPEEADALGRSRRWIYGSLAAGVLLVAGLALATLGRGPAADPEPAPAAVEVAPAPVPERAAPGPAAAAEDPVRLQIEALVDEQLERREEELRRAFEEEEKKLLEELRRLRTDKAPAQDAG